MMEPSDAGGVAAKHGFLFQDCFAALLITEMLLNKEIISVSFEVIDDIDVTWKYFKEFIQVKAAAETGWTPTAITKCATSKSAVGGRAKKISDSSIVHKQMSQATQPINLCQFRMVSTEDPKGLLDYLQVKRGKRFHRSSDRDTLCVDLNARLKNFVAPSGNDVSHWIDSTLWQVHRSINELELLAMRNIRIAATEIAGVTLSNEAAAEAIWHAILVTLTKRSALSRKIYCADEKTYHSSNLRSWFRAEVNVHEVGSREWKKVYVRKLPEPILEILHTFASPTGRPTRTGQVMHQQYSLGIYRYEYIASSFCQWLDEVLLLPNEIADISTASVTQKYTTLANRVKASQSDFNELFGKVLLHSAIRHEIDSQPIPASLYTDHPSGVKLLENVHIVINHPEPDELWTGFSHVFEGSDIAGPIKHLRDDLYLQIADHIDPVRERILLIKQDQYLLAHDVDHLLETRTPIDTHGSRFRFIIFIGYSSTVSGLETSEKFRRDLIDEAEALLTKFCDDFPTSEAHALYIRVYFYPIPSIGMLTRKVREKLVALY